MSVSLTWLTDLLFIAIRLGTVLLFTPIQAIHQLPVHVRLLFVFSLSILFSNFLPAKESLNNTILFSSIAEFCNGLIFATSLSAVFAVFQIAGQLIDSEIGLNSIALFNPNEHSQEPLTSRLLAMLAVLFFFSLDGHVWMFKGLAYSFIIIPPGTLALFSGFAPVVKQFGLMFTIAFMLASPIILTLLAIDLCGGLITRNMPQVSIYFVTLPIKIGVGFLVLIMQLNFFNPMTTKVFQYWMHVWQEILS